MKIELQANFFNQITASIAQKTPFVAFKLPNNPALFFLNSSTINWQKLAITQNPSFVIAPFSFSASNQNVLQFDFNTAISIDEDASFLPIILPEVERIEGDVIHKTKHLALVYKAIETINSKNLEKIVVSRKESNPKTKDWDSIYSFRSLCNSFPQSFVCWLFAPKLNLEWMGATPEQFLKVENNEAISMALAGTRAANNQVMWGAKEKYEQEIVTNYLKSVFDQYCTEVKVEATKTLASGSIEHLLNLVTGKLDPAKLQTFITELHPTPAVGGLPKETAIEFIIENEDYERNLYSGFWGILGRDSCNLFVNLRCFQITETSLDFYAGGGITTDSDPEKEWEETERKIANTKSKLGF